MQRRVWEWPLDGDGEMQLLKLEYRDRTLDWSAESLQYLESVNLPQDRPAEFRVNNSVEFEMSISDDLESDTYLYLMPLVIILPIIALIILWPRRHTLVILGAYTNHHPGRTSDLQNIEATEYDFMSFLLGAYDKQAGKFVTICITQIKFTDKELKKLHELLVPRILETKPENVHSLILPDVWFAPDCGMNVKIKNIQPSREHTAGRVTSQNQLENMTPDYIVAKYINNRQALGMIEKEYGLEITDFKIRDKFSKGLAPNKVLDVKRLMRIYNKHFRNP